MQEAAKGSPIYHQLVWLGIFTTLPPIIHSRNEDARRGLDGYCAVQTGCCSGNDRLLHLGLCGDGWRDNIIKVGVCTPPMDIRHSIG